ncbi:SH3 domain-containing protein [Isoptericola dokdonensis]|uniref:Murein hydrolase activator NlpD n=1 Tax=Isoptericola dokdonensis DS-3 TaxID=1300344 RepID=A0A161IEE9_9MICO|nr:SH3 domain-containing protein [Isoptericola dokdonensis]ANC31727.1 Murein hydrolase activator NlpD precursor [Isoptericola dokdonensis DS-3]
MGRIRAGARRALVAVATTTSLVVAGAAVAPSASAATVVSPPLKDDTYVLSSYYGARCMPVRSASTFHLGQDLGAASGTDVRAVAKGKVVKAGAVRGFGQWVVVDHTLDGKKFSSLYAHVIDGDGRVKVGQTVKKGQHIADVGSTGTSTSPHLHLEIWKGGYGSGSTVDPLKFLRYRGVDLTKRSIRNYTRSTPPASCGYFTAGKVNLRSGPGTGYKILRTLQPNVVIKGKPGVAPGEWRQVTRNGRTGWVHRDYVSPSYTSQGSRYTLAQLNLRAKPSTSARVVRALPADAHLTMLRSLKGSWQRVRYGSTNGWVHARYLSDTRDGAQVVRNPSGSTYSWVDVSTLHLRKGASTSTAKVATLKRDARVKHLATMSGGWIKVQVGSKTGYVASRYLTSDRP